MKKVLFAALSILMAALIISCTTTTVKENHQFVYDLTITNQNKDYLDETLYASSFYNLDLCFDSDTYSLCKVDLINEKGKVAVTKYVFPDENNHFLQKLYLNAKTTKLDISVQDKATSEFSLIHSYKLLPTLEKTTPLMSYDKKTGITTYTIDHTNVDFLPNHLQVGKIYTFDINLSELDFIKAAYEIRLKDVYPPAQPYQADELTLQPKGHYVKTVLLPNNVHELSIYLFGSYWTDQMNVAFFRAEPSKKPAKLNLPDNLNLEKAKSYLKDKPDQRIINYLEEIDGRQLSKENPDKALIQFIEKIEEITQDPYEKIVLINDTIWYLLAYDMKNWENNEITPQEYKDVLRRGVCVCEGFSKVFTQMCFLADIPCCEVRGFGLHLKPEELQALKNSDNYYYLNEFGHQWNIIMVENCWYPVDITWNCCHFIDGKRTDTYLSRFLFSDPKEFLKSHYPNFDELQLVKNPVSLSEIIDYLIAGDLEKDLVVD